ncbi:MAG: MBL fold metallo-hydrolase [Burkholderiales bacterium]|nr:MAG: MBL fold metallo-hydrolase [Betaproteobacteria bacterium]TAG84011.1 MAG: MBL fold metallo-hydrolase [Burkholderiales bacterium]
MNRYLASGFLLVLLTVGCTTLITQSTNVNYDASKKHHTAEGFRNNYPHPTDQNFWKWQWERLTQNTVAKAPAAGWASVLPSVKPDVTFLKANRSERTITWLGHATVLLQVDGVNIITDPVFSARTAPVQFAGPKREVPFMVTPDELPEIDVVFVSHNHYDHLDEGSILDFKTRFPKATYLIPIGLKPWFTARGVTNVRELDWWDSIELAGLKYTFTPAQHWSKRTLNDTNRSLWGGIVVEARRNNFPPLQGEGQGGDSFRLPGNQPNTFPHPAAPLKEEEPMWRFIYTGDTGYSQDFKDIAARFPEGFDWAAIPIGAYEPRWFMRAQHVNPDESVQVFQDLRAKAALSVHWGTWMLTDEALDQPPKDLSIALKKYGVDPARFHVFKNGESRKI